LIVYAVAIKRSASKDLEDVGEPHRRRLRDAIAELATAPRPFGSIKMAGEDSYYRIRVGDYRAIYVVNDEAKRVTVIRVRHRSDVYK
jgi:mRNA interferase RelE/StbE